jgi:hypothetical protein
MALVLHCQRASEELAYPQFWGEDGSDFYKGAFESGPASLLFPYANYLVLYQRFIALISMYFDLLYVPQLFQFGALLGHLVLLLVTWSPRFQVHSRVKILFSVMPLLVPHGGEVILNLTNSQWFLGLALFIRFMSDGPRNIFDWLTDIVLLSIAGLTGPFLVIFAPIAVIHRVAFEKNRAKSVPDILPVLVTLGISFGMGSFGSRWDAAGHMTTSLTPWMTAFAKFFNTLVLSAFSLSRMDQHWVALAIALTLSFVFYSSFKASNARQRFVTLSYLYGIGIIWLSGLWMNRAAPDVMGPFDSEQRYFFVPYVLLGWFLSIQSMGDTVPKHTRKISILLLLLIAAGGISYFKTFSKTQFDFKGQVGRLYAEGYSEFLVPPGWKFTLDCKKLWYESHTIMAAKCAPFRQTDLDGTTSSIEYLSRGHIVDGLEQRR